MMKIVILEEKHKRFVPLSIHAQKATKERVEKIMTLDN